MIFSHCAMPNDKLYLVTFIIIVIMYNDGKKWRVTLICNFVDSKKNTPAKSKSRTFCVCQLMNRSLFVGLKKSKA